MYVHALTKETDPHLRVAVGPFEGGLGDIFLTRKGGPSPVQFHKDRMQKGFRIVFYVNNYFIWLIMPGNLTHTEL